MKKKRSHCTLVALSATVCESEDKPSNLLTRGRRRESAIDEDGKNYKKKRDKLEFVFFHGEQNSTTIQTTRCHNDLRIETKGTPQSGTVEGKKRIVVVLSQSPLSQTNIPYSGKVSECRHVLLGVDGRTDDRGGKRGRGRGQGNKSVTYSPPPPNRGGGGRGRGWWPRSFVPFNFCPPPSFYPNSWSFLPHSAPSTIRRQGDEMQEQFALLGMARRRRRRRTSPYLL